MVKKVILKTIVWDPNGEFDPVGKDMSNNEGFPAPAQAEVIPAVLEQKFKQISEGTMLSIEVWERPDDGEVFIQDGQHRFVASCIKGARVKFDFLKRGMPPPNAPRSWEGTKFKDVEAAKDMLRRNIDAAREQKDQEERGTFGERSGTFGEGKDRADHSSGADEEKSSGSSESTSSGADAGREAADRQDEINREQDQLNRQNEETIRRQEEETRRQEDARRLEEQSSEME